MAWGWLSAGENREDSCVGPCDDLDRLDQRQGKKDIWGEGKTQDLNYGTMRASMR